MTTTDTDRMNSTDLEDVIGLVNEALALVDDAHEIDAYHLLGDSLDTATAELLKASELLALECAAR
jgi:hypothetical protein